MKTPKVGDAVRYVEKTPQDDGKEARLSDVDAVVVLIHEGENVACATCHDLKGEHDRPRERHGFAPQANTLTLDVSFSAWGRHDAKVIQREHVEYGKKANQWHK